MLGSFQSGGDIKHRTGMKVQVIYGPWTRSLTSQEGVLTFSLAVEEKLIYTSACSVKKHEDESVNLSAYS